MRILPVRRKLQIAVGDSPISERDPEGLGPCRVGALFCNEAVEREKKVAREASIDALAINGGATAPFFF